MSLRETPLPTDVIANLRYVRGCVNMPEAMTAFLDRFGLRRAHFHHGAAILRTIADAIGTDHDQAIELHFVGAEPTADHPARLVMYGPGDIAGVVGTVVRGSFALSEDIFYLVDPDRANRYTMTIGKAFIVINGYVLWGELTPAVKDTA